MKVLITGEKGYIATCLARYLNESGDFTARQVSVRNGFAPYKLSEYDAIVHAAAIVHQMDKNIPYEQYLEVNTTLTRELADAALKAGVKHFVFFSSMGVYEGYAGKKAEMPINNKTDVSFSSAYASTKYGAEELLREIDNELNISIIRPPLVYGKGSPGNIHRLFRFAGKTPFFPLTDNLRSMIYIDNLCELIRLILINQKTGLFCPQNAEYVNVSDLITLMGHIQGNGIALLKIPGPIIKLSLKFQSCNKVFGNYYYDKDFSSCFDNAYQIVGFEESIINTFSKPLIIS